MKKENFIMLYWVFFNLSGQNFQQKTNWIQLMWFLHKSLNYWKKISWAIRCSRKISKILRPNSNFEVNFKNIIIFITFMVLHRTDLYFSKNWTISAHKEQTRSTRCKVTESFRRHHNIRSWTSTGRLFICISNCFSTLCSIWHNAYSKCLEQLWSFHRVSRTKKIIRFKKVHSE